VNLNVHTELRVATSGMAWKGEENEAVTAIPADDIKWAQWIRVARDFQLRVGLKDRRRETFDGFMREVRKTWWRYLQGRNRTNGTTPGPRQAYRFAQAALWRGFGGEGCHIQRVELGSHRYSRCVQRSEVTGCRSLLLRPRSGFFGIKQDGIRATSKAGRQL
jgi:hypothetical protein